MSLQLDGLLNAVPLADEGTYIDENGNPQFLERSGAKCKGMRFNLILYTASGGLVVSNTVKYSLLSIMENMPGQMAQADLMPLDGLFNYGALVASNIATLSNGVIGGLSVELGLFRNDEQFVNLGSTNNKLIIGVETKQITRDVEGVDKLITLTHPGNYSFVIPFVGSNVGGNLNDLPVFEYADEFKNENKFYSFVGNIKYCFGYLKYENENENSIIGVYSRQINLTKNILANYIPSPNLINNDSGLGIKVKGSESFGSGDNVISERFHYILNNLGG